ncbi:long-chain-fatty-acid--CoA ligase FadD15 [bacterium BMS3Abin04]|nr:long-chain-fatty-acid--CoA ligase FadD15 [bacterium BMS3Abin04]
MGLPTIKYNRLFDVLDYQIENFPRKDAIRDKIEGDWRKYSSEEVKSIVKELSLGLLKNGYGPADKIAIISKNRCEWNFADLAAQQVNAVIVPLYPNMSEDNYEFIFTDAHVKIVFVENDELLKKVNDVRAKIKWKIEVYTFDKSEHEKQWTELRIKHDEVLENKLEEIKKSINKDELATIIYTSGTTGVPKGVMLSHNNIMSNVASLSLIIPIKNIHRVISFLPLCHIFERTAFYFYYSVGASISYAESMDKIGDNIKEIKPNYFTTVPRLLEKIFDKIMEKGRSLSGLKKAIFGWAVNLGNHYNPKGENNIFYNIRLWGARKLVFSKWVEALGGEVQGIISGSAALQPRLGRIFTAAGIPVVEGYGLTETSPVITCDRFEKGEYYIGTVGSTIPGVEIKIGENDEILTKGPNLMLGYYNKPDATKEVIDEDGWFHTGDVGKIIEGKFLKITDRLKEIFKTSGGKFVIPMPIENKMKESLFIEEIMVVGENRRFTAAIIVPNFEFVEKWCQRKCLELKTREQLINSDILKERIWKDIQKFNKRFGHIQQVKKIALVLDQWTVETGELTPTLKLKRRVLLKKYKELIEEIYHPNENSKYKNIR